MRDILNPEQKLTCAWNLVSQGEPPHLVAGEKPLGPQKAVGGRAPCLLCNRVDWFYS